MWHPGVRVSRSSPALAYLVLRPRLVDHAHSSRLRMRRFRAVTSSTDSGHHPVGARHRAYGLDGGEEALEDEASQGCPAQVSSRLLGVGTMRAGG